MQLLGSNTLLTLKIYPRFTADVFLKMLLHLLETIIIRLNISYGLVHEIWILMTMVSSEGSCESAICADSPEPSLFSCSIDVEEGSDQTLNLELCWI